MASQKNLFPKDSGINKPVKATPREENASYLSRPLEETMSQGNALEQSTASINDSHGLTISNLTLMALVSRAKRFSLDSAKQVRDLQARKGLTLFWDLHSNLAGRREPVSKETQIRGATMTVPGHKNGEKYERSHEYDFHQWEQWDIVEFPDGSG